MARLEALLATDVHNLGFILIGEGGDRKIVNAEFVADVRAMKLAELGQSRALKEPKDRQPAAVLGLQQARMQYPPFRRGTAEAERRRAPVGERVCQNVQISVSCESIEKQ